MNTEDLKKELQQKERSIKDLLRFISTRNDRNPNYSLLLGSGCSVTSNIKSGGTLINEWRQEIYENLSKDDRKEQKKSYSIKNAKKYFTKKHASWYNSSNEYSSLFEKKYDLPRQRRMFVEKEVGNKIPSIGYAYLINLIEDTYFNTVFTTNFDDLINEAFYQFSEKRPMICAHDSSINSITVTSKRPKIIKLHGDYLFDDIKSTLRETESLEDNIRNKFIEFAKDYGLIVVGYGGHDRSIMDVINYLLKHEDYYKNGLYWCLRKDDMVGEELRKLLWKDRVYFVEIDGFDELFANLHNAIFQDKLPIDTNFISNKSQDIIQNFIENKYLKNTKSKIIADDIKNLEIQNERNNLYDALKQMKSDDTDDNDKFENKEVKVLIELSSLYKEDKYEQVITTINNILLETNNKDFKIELYKRMINSYNRLEDNNNAIKTIDKLIELDKNNPTNLIYKLNITNSMNEKILLIDKAIEMDSFNERFFNKKVDLLIETYDIYEKDEIKLDDIKKLLAKSVEVNPHISNAVWSIKFDFLFELDSKNNELKEIIQTLNKQQPYSIKVLNMKYNLLSDNKERENFLITVNEAKDKFLNDNKLKYELLILKIFDKLNNKKEISKLLESLTSNELYKNDSIFLRTKATLLLEKFDLLSDAIEILKKSLKEKRTTQTILQLINYLLHANKIDEANNILISNKFILSEEQRINIKKDILDTNKDYVNSYKEIEKLQKLHTYNSDLYVNTFAYNLLKQEKYTEAKKLLRGYLEKKNFNPKLEAEIVNYELACKLERTTYKVDKKRLEAVRNNTNSNSTKAAINALEEKESDTIKEIENQLDKDFSSKYEFKDWPVFYKIKDNPQFKKLID